MATNPGPFSEYLQKQLEQPQQQPRLTGYEGAMGNIANIATQFLQGIKQGRIQRFAQKQEEEEKNLNRLGAAAKMIESMPDITPEAKAQQLGEIYKQILGQAASVPETNKQTGHHLTDMFKGMFTNMVGGELPKQQNLDMSVLTKAFDAVNEPTNRISHNLSLQDQAISNRIDQLRKEKGDLLTQGDVYADPGINESIRRARVLNPDFSPSSFISLVSSPD